MTRESTEVDNVVRELVHGHLLMEEAITRFVEQHLSHPHYFSDASLRFYQKSTLARSLCPGNPEAAEWLLIHAINALRNTLAHALRSEERDKRVARVRRTFFKETSETPERAALQDATDEAVVKAACAHCLAFLHALEKK